MEEEAFEDNWADFMAAQGLALEDELEESIRDSVGLLDIQDGTHAQWVEEDLAVLFVFLFPHSRGTTNRPLSLRAWR